MLIATKLVIPDSTIMMAYTLAIVAISLLISAIVIRIMNHVNTVNIPVSGHANAGRNVKTSHVIVNACIAIIMSVSIASPCIASIYYRAQAIITQNQVTATMDAFSSYYGISHITTNKDDISSALIHAFTGKHYETVGITYVDNQGRFRDGSIVLSHGKMTLYASDFYVNAKLTPTITKTTSNTDTI